jgi:ClpP class serine protease
LKSGRFEPRSSVLALDPRAWGMIFDAPDRSNEHRGQTILVSVRGPLMHHEDWIFDSYDAIKSRVLAAIAEKPGAIVLCLDSPGGLVSGCFDTAAEIREACEAAAIPLYAYVDGAALSAAYALACACSRIVTPATGAVGSIGCIEMMVDATEANARSGVRAELIASGARKTDGNPNTPITDEAIAAVRTNVEALAGVFFETVAASRGVSVEAVRAMQAAIVTGARALPLKLVDEVATLEQMLAAIASGQFASAPSAEGEETMTTKGSKAYEDAIAALRKAANGDDDEAKKAKRMLAAELAEDAPEKKDEESEEEGKAKAEGDDEEKKDEPAARAPGSVSASTAGEIATRLTAVEKLLETQARAEIFASRPDLPASLVKVLATKPVDEVRAIVGAIEKPKTPKLGDAAAAAQVAGTRGAGQDERADRLPATEAAAMDQAMGLTSTKLGVKREGATLYLGAVLPTK